MTTKKPQAKSTEKPSVKQVKPMASVVKSLSTGVVRKEVIKSMPGTPSGKVAVKTTDTTVRKVEVKPVAANSGKPVVVPVIKKSSVKKPVAKPVHKAAKAVHKPVESTKLVLTSELTSQALRNDATPPWDDHTTVSETQTYLNQGVKPADTQTPVVVPQRREYDKPIAPAPQRREYDKPVSVKAAVNQTQGLSMAQIRSNLARSMMTGSSASPVADRDVGAPYLRTESVKTPGGISIKEVFRHIAKGPWVNHQR